MAAPMQCFTRLKCCNYFSKYQALQSSFITRHCNLLKQTRLYCTSDSSHGKSDDDFFGIDENNTQIDVERSQWKRDTAVSEDARQTMSNNISAEFTDIDYNNHSTRYRSDRTDNFNKNSRHNDRQSSRENKISKPWERNTNKDRHNSSIDKYTNFSHNENFKSRSRGKQWSKQTDLNHNNNDLNLIDDQYFRTLDHEEINKRSSFKKNKSGDVDNFSKRHSPRQESNMGDLEYVDEQFFKPSGVFKPGIVNSEMDKFQKFKVKDNIHAAHQNFERKNLNIIDEQYFGDHTSSEVENNSMDRLTSRSKQTKTLKDSNSPKVSSNSSEKQSKQSSTAYEYAMEIRNKRRMEEQSIGSYKTGTETEGRKPLFEARPNEPLDSKGFRILKYQTPDIMNTPSGLVVDTLKNSIVYDHGDVLAINKPYGLPALPGPGYHLSVEQLLPELSSKLRYDESTHNLQIINQLELNTTGVMLIAKTDEMAQHLHGLFKNGEVSKIYWVITKGVPDPPKGVIRIPVTNADMGNGRRRMALRPDFDEQYSDIMKKRSVENAVEAITKYNLISQSDSAALVQCEPLTGARHQLRVHLGFGMNTPILGDHKYSHYNKFAPQRLPPDMLSKLGIRMSKVRHVPLHIHMKILVLPEFKDGRNIIIRAPLPKHFRTNMGRLKLDSE